jgi:hypothetical protein
MQRRTLLAGGAAVLGVLSVGYALFAPVSDEELIVEVLDELAAALSFSEPIQNPIFFGSRLSERFQDVFAEQVNLRVAEVSARIPSHRGQLGLAAAQALSRYGSLDVSFGSTTVNVSGQSAQVTSEASVVGTFQGEMRRDSRSVDFDFVLTDGDWQIAGARVEAAE